MRLNRQALTDDGVEYVLGLLAAFALREDGDPDVLNEWYHDVKTRYMLTPQQRCVINLFKIMYNGMKAKEVKND